MMMYARGVCIYNICCTLTPFQPVLVVKSLHKEFVRPAMKSATQRMVAVKNLTFRVMPGEVLGLLGPNGAGKSTTLNMLTAEIIPDAGMVRYFLYGIFFSITWHFMCIILYLIK